MSNFPAIPLSKQTEKNVKLFLDGLAGRMGVEGRAVLFSDLFDAGIIQLKDGVTLENIQQGTDPSDVVEIPTGELPQNPTVPHTLTVASSWGALFLTWEYDAYNNEYGTEIWRSLVNDRSTASLIAVKTGRAKTDNVGEKAGYYYWVRNRSASNTVSGYNAGLTGGVYGESNLKTTAADFILKNPEAEFVPLTIENFGTELVPDWKILLNGEVIVTSDLTIGSLTTGKMRENTTFTVGNASIEIGTDSGGLGYMTITGDGGITGKDYLRITNGSITSFVYDPDIAEHVEYKELKRMERGITQHDVQTIIPAYFKSEPTVYLTFEDIQVYSSDPSHQDQDQSILMNVGAVTPHPTVNGSWVFTPNAVLTLTDGVRTELEPYDTYTILDTAEYTSLHEFLNCEGATFNFTLGSAKATAGGDYQNRIITVIVQGSLNGGAYSQIATDSVDLTGDGVDLPLVINVPVLTSGTWKFKYLFTAADRTGTTPGGGETYDYENDNSTTGEILDLINTVGAGDSLSQVVVNNRPTRGAEWKLFEIDYSFTVDWEADSWCVITKSGTFPENASGSAEVTIPNVIGSFEAHRNCIGGSDGEIGICNGYLPTSSSHYTGDSGTGVVGGTGGKISITEDDPLYLAGKYSASGITAVGSSAVADICSGDRMGNGRAHVEVTGFDVTYYYRKLKVVDTEATNHFKVDSVIANLGATEISVGAATINWLAVGE